MSGIWELAGPLGSQGWPSDDLKGKCEFSIVKTDTKWRDLLFRLHFGWGKVHFVV